MAYKDIIRLFNERKRKLSNIIDMHQKELDQDRIYKIRGAIDEIDFLLMTLSQYQSSRSYMVQEGYSNPALQITNPEKQSLLKRLGSAFRGQSQGKVPTTSSFMMNEHVNDRLSQQIRLQ